LKSLLHIAYETLLGKSGSGRCIPRETLLRIVVEPAAEAAADEPAAAEKIIALASALSNSPTATTFTAARTPAHNRWVSTKHSHRKPTN